MIKQKIKRGLRGSNYTEAYGGKPVFRPFLVNGTSDQKIIALTDLLGPK